MKESFTETPEHEAYLNWLKEQAEKDEQDRIEGRPPLPRSAEEQEAIFFAVPRGQRYRLRRWRENSTYHGAWCLCRGCRARRNAQ